MAAIAIFPGTFDPITNGHIDLISRGAELFSKVVVGVAKNSNKTPTFNLEQRVSMCEETLMNITNVEVVGFENLLVSLAKQHNASVILRGLRAVSDFEYEFQLANMNRKISPEIETVFLSSSEHSAYISSTLVKEVALLGGNVSAFVPDSVEKALTAL